MAVNIINKSRKDGTLTTSFNRSQRSSCAVVIYPYLDAGIVKLANINVANDQSLGSKAAFSNQRNVAIRNKVTIRQDILNCTISNNKGSSSGNFTLTLKRGKEIKGGNNQPTNINYLDLIHPGDWITIYMKKSGEISDDDVKTNTVDSGFKFLGIIENVRYIEVDNPGSASPRLEYIITGRSFGKVFDTNLFFNPVVNKSAAALLGAEFLKDSSKQLKGAGFTPDQAVKKLLNFYFGGKLAASSLANENWYVPDSLIQTLKGTPAQKNKNLGRSFIDIINTSRIGLQTNTPTGFKSVSPLIGRGIFKALPTSGTIWSVLEFVSNTVINEMYTDLVPIGPRPAPNEKDTRRLQPALVVRQVPFSNKEGQITNVFTKTGKKDPIKNANLKGFFTNLPQHVIVSTDIKQKNIGTSDHERINYVIVAPKIDQTNVEALYAAGMNAPSIQRYGLKTFQAETPYTLDPTFNIKKMCEFCVWLLEDWFFLSHSFYNGTIITDGVDKYVEVGQNLYIEDIKQLFHIEGYTHSYEVMPTGATSYDTEFRVSRGQVFSNNKSTFIGPTTSANEPTTVVTSHFLRTKEK